MKLWRFSNKPTKLEGVRAMCDAMSRLSHVRAHGVKRASGACRWLHSISGGAEQRAFKSNEPSNQIFCAHLRALTTRGARPHVHRTSHDHMFRGSLVRFLTLQYLVHHTLSMPTLGARRVRVRPACACSSMLPHLARFICAQNTGVLRSPEHATAIRRTSGCAPRPTPPRNTKVYPHHGRRCSFLSASFGRPGECSCCDCTGFSPGREASVPTPLRMPSIQSPT